MIKTVYDVTSAGKPDAPRNRRARGRPWLTFAGLKKLTDDTLAALNAVGIGRGDRVAMVARRTGRRWRRPSSPSRRAPARRRSTRPIAPTSSSSISTTCKPKAVIVQQGMDSPVRGMAEKVGVPIIELIPTADGPAGSFTLDVSCAQASQGCEARHVGRWRDRAGAAHRRARRRGPRSCRCRRANLAASARATSRRRWR